MTDYYFDSVNGTDGLDGLTPANAKQSYDAYAQGTMTAGDTYYFKRGTTNIIPTENTQVKQGVNAAVRTKYKAYGVAQVPYSIWTPSPTGTLANDFILNGSGRSYIDYEDMYFDCLGRVSYSIYMVASASAVSSSHKISRCYFTNAKVTGSGLVVGAASTTPGAGTDIIIEDSFFFANPTHGMLVNGANGVIVRRSKFYGNGFNATAGGHGFSAKARRTDATSGWTRVGTTTVWYRSLASYEPDVYYCKTSVSGYQRLAKNTSTPTTPGLGEYGVDSALLYINVNSTSDPGGQGVNYNWGRCFNILLEDNESYGNIWDTSHPLHEGHGFAFDDYTESSIARRNHSHGNQGCAFTINRGDNNLLESNIGHDNWLAGVAASGCWNTTVRHNTFHSNNTGSGAYNGEIAFSTYAQNGVISNNILKGTRTYGIDLDTTCAGFSGSNNNVYGPSAVDRSGAFTASVTDDPLLDSEHRATAATVKRGGIYLGGRDYYGKYHTNPPSIGAVSDHRTPAWAAVATR